MDMWQQIAQERLEQIEKLQTRIDDLEIELNYYKNKNDNDYKNCFKRIGYLYKLRIDNKCREALQE